MQLIALLVRCSVLLALVLSATSLAAPLRRSSSQQLTAFGTNVQGQCTVPLPPQGVDVVDVVAGGHHALALLGNGSVLAWGSNSQGQCNVPALPPNTTYNQIYAGGYHSLAVRSDGAILSWGDNTYGQCTVPTPPLGLTFLKFALGNAHSVGLLSNGGVLCWGNNWWGQCNGPGSAPGTVYVDVAAGGAHSLALSASGSIAPWGYNFYGQCNVPSLPFGRYFVSLDAGAFFSAAILNDGSMVAWGEDNIGQCQVPWAPAGVTFVSFSLGVRHGLALRSDGQVVGWGTNGAGEAIVPPLSQSNVVLRVECGDGFSVVLQSAQCGNVMTYCTAATTIHGCVPGIQGIGAPSLASSSGFVVSVGSVPGQRFGTLMYSFNRTAVAWAPNSSSFRCVAFPVQRLGDRSSGGVAGQCNGQLTLDFLDWIATHPGAMGAPLIPGMTIHTQGWFRDPGAAKQTNLSNALTFTLCN